MTPQITLDSPALWRCAVDRLSPALLERAAEPMSVVIDEESRTGLRRAHEFALACMADRPVYGATTGFGPLVDFPGRADSVAQCDNALAHLTVGHGGDLPVGVVRAALLVRLWSLGRGRSGVSVRVLDSLAAMLGTDFAPAVPRLGSVGASGDLVPLAYAARALSGSGWAYLGDRRLPAGAALREAGLRPLELDGRDALGLVNGTSLTAAAAGLALASARRAHGAAVLLSALLADLLGCAPAFLSPRLLAAFGHPETAAVGSRMRALLAGTVPSGARSLQEPYSIRCTPQLLGAVRQSLDHADRVVQGDLAGVSDNPLFFAETDEVAHGGNFFGQPVAFAADALATAIVALGNLCERQVALLVDPHRNGGRPPMLATVPGEQHGVQGLQLVATATVAAMRRAAVPASVQSLSTNLHNQDVVPFGTQAALNALDIATLQRWQYGALAVALRQAAHVGDRGPTAPACIRLLDRLAEVIPPVDPDRPLDADVARAADALDVLVEEEAIPQ